MLESDEWNDREATFAELRQTIKFIHEEVLERLKYADMRNKEAFDKRQKGFQKKYNSGDLVLMKNRTFGVFDPPLVGPFEFIRYKQGGRAAWLKDDSGREFDVSVTHLVPVD